MNAFEELAFQLGAFQSEVAAGSFAFQECVFQADAFQADVCYEETEQVGGGNGGKHRKSKRKIYIINGIRYLLPDDEDIKIEEPLENPVIEFAQSSYDDTKNIEDYLYASVRNVMIRSAIPEVQTKTESKHVNKKPAKQVIKDDEEELLLMMF